MRKINTFKKLFPRPNMIPLSSQSPNINNIPQTLIKPNLPVVRAVSNYHRPILSQNLINNDFIPSSLTIPKNTQIINPINNIKPVNIANMNNFTPNVSPVQAINKFVPLNNNLIPNQNQNMQNPISQGSVVINNPINKANSFTSVNNINRLNSPRIITNSPIQQGSIVVNRNPIPPMGGNIITNNNIINNKPFVGIGNNTSNNNVNNITNVIPMNNININNMNNNNIKPVPVIMRNNLVQINNNFHPNQNPTPPPVSIQNPTPAPIPIQNISPPPVSIQNPTPAPIPIQNISPTPIPIQNISPTPIPIQNTNPTPIPIQNISPTPMPIQNTNPTPIPIQNPTPSPIKIQNVNPPPIIQPKIPTIIPNINNNNIIPFKPINNQNQNIIPINQISPTKANIVPMNPTNIIPINPPKPNIISINSVNTPKTNIIPINPPKTNIIPINPINPPKVNIIPLNPTPNPNIIPINPPQTNITNLIPMNSPRKKAIPIIPPPTNISNIIPYINPNLIPGPYLNISEYEIEQEIGKGSFGEIFRVKWKLNQKYYALKIETLSDMEGINTRLSRGESMRKFVQSTGCEGVVNIYGSYFMKKGQDFIYYELMDLCDTDFEKEIKMRSEYGSYFTEGEIDNIIKQLISTLSFLQKHHITHRDIKPQNILIANGKYKLCDFGDIRVIQKQGVVVQRIRGSELYMSPILFNGLRRGLMQVQHNTYKSDVFSLGMCLFYAACLSFDGPVEIREVINMNIKAQILNKYLSARYSQKLIKILYLMLQTEESIRPDFIILEKAILKYGL